MSQVSAASVLNDNKEKYKLVAEKNDLAEVFEDDPIIVIDQNELKLMKMLTEQKKEEAKVEVNND